MNLKRFGAIAAVIVLVGVYVLTLILALIHSPETLNMLKASVFLTIFLPVTLYAYIFIAKILHK